MDLMLFKDLVVLLAAAVLIITFFHKLKIPPVVGFLLTGVLIGPGGFALIRNSGTINVLAEIGVIMLLFMIGLEFSPSRLKNIRRNFFLGGGLQVLLTVSATGVILILFGIPARTAVFYGFLVSLSSTAVVMRILSDRGETDAPYGRLSLGILIFQDIAIVPMVAFVPVLADVRSASPSAILLRFLLSGAVIAAVFFAGRFLMPRLLHAVVRTRIREVFLITSLFVCLGMAWLTSSLGLSLALGAFLAGIMLSESEYSHQVVSDILPFKDVFNSLFFISIGMLLNTAMVWKFGLLIFALVFSILVIKAAIIVLTARVLGFGSRIALVAGLAMAQIGEFSFVLAGVGRSYGLLSDDVFQIFLASSIMTILATPLLIQLSPGLADRAEKSMKWLGRTTKGSAEVPRIPDGHVIVAGYGLNGRNLAHVLREAGIGYVILDVDPESIRRAIQNEDPVIFGDATSRTILAEARIGQAKGIVFAISDPAATRRAVQAARDLNKSLFIIVRTRYATEIDELFRLGANDVIPEEFETSIEIFTRVLGKFHIPKNIIDAQVKILKGECYGFLRGSCEAEKPSMEKISEFLTAGTVEPFFLPQASWAVGQTIGEIDLRRKTGATVIAVVRGETSFTSPGADFGILAGDSLVLVASHQDMDRAFAYLGAAEKDS